MMVILMVIDKLIFPEIGTFGPSLAMVPPMLFLEFIGLGNHYWLIIPATLLFLFILGTIMGFIIQKVKNTSPNKVPGR